MGGVFVWEDIAGLKPSSISQLLAPPSETRSTNSTLIEDWTCRVDYIGNQAVQSNSQKRIAGNAFGMSKALSERGILRWGFSAEALLKS